MDISFLESGCRKGNRECLYPEPQAISKSTRGGGKSNQKSSTDTSSPEDPEDEDAQERLEPILDEEDEDLETNFKPRVKQESLREASDTPSLTLDRSPTPSTEASSTVTRHAGRPTLSRRSSNQTTRTGVPVGKPTPNLPEDIKFYLDYFKNHMSFHHYSFKRDSGSFLKNDFLNMAVKHEPLRYAVVGYAAYFHTLSKPDGRMSDFLQYYTESVSRLRASITKSKKQGLSTFLTILQLASIEVTPIPCNASLPANTL
jgi:hypothetical protein